MLTAAHCIKGAATRDITVSVFTEKVERGLNVKSFVCRPTADVAILEIADFPLFDPFLGETSIYNWGMPVSAFGYVLMQGSSRLHCSSPLFVGRRESAGPVGLCGSLTFSAPRFAPRSTLGREQRPSSC
jgi:hypothetical protein